MPDWVMTSIPSLEFIISNETIGCPYLVPSSLSRLSNNKTSHLHALKGSLIPFHFSLILLGITCEDFKSLSRSDLFPRTFSKGSFYGGSGCSCMKKSAVIVSMFSVQQHVSASVMRNHSGIIRNPQVYIPFITLPFKCRFGIFSIHCHKP